MAGPRSLEQPVEPHLPHRSVVVVAGLPGAGKSTTVRRLSRSATVLALDSEDVARGFGRLPAPYRNVRPLVHAAHLARVLLTLWSSHPCVLTSDPLTSPLRRHLFRAGAWLSARRLLVVLVHVSPAEARDGQRLRGRALSARRMARHERRYRRWRSSGRATVDLVLTPDEATSVLLLPHPDLLRACPCQNSVLAQNQKDAQASASR